MEEKQRASVAFNKLVVAMETLGITAGEQKAIWHVLAAIYHIGAAGACKGTSEERRGVLLCPLSASRGGVVMVVVRGVES